MLLRRTKCSSLLGYRKKLKKISVALIKSLIHNTDMLKQLKIQDFAIIDHCELEFQNGFTVFTGETGAGKSIIMDALSMLMGKPGSEQLIKSTSEYAWVEGVFQLQNIPDILHDFVDSDGMVIIQRKLSRQKDSIAKLNGHSVPLKLLKSIVPQFVSIVGQNEHIAVANTDYQLKWLDLHLSEDEEAVKNTFKSAYSAYQELKKKAETLLQNDRDLHQKIEFLQFQHADITSQNFKIDEEDTLTAHRKQTQNKLKITQSLEQLSGSMASAQEHIQASLKPSGFLSTIDAKWEPVSTALQSCLDTLSEQAAFIESETQTLSQDEPDIDAIESRLDTIFKYKTKYHQPHLNQLLDYQEKLGGDIKSLEILVHQKTTIETDLNEAFKTACIYAEKLSKIRHKHAQAIQKNIENTLKSLHFQSPKFNVTLNYSTDTLTHEGGDTPSFEVSLNPGEPLKPLAKVASGGELSRIMLALRSEFIDKSEPQTLIFDEVDTGIGGLTANTIGQFLKKISDTSQLLCITHLPQIARLADHHLLVQKTHTEKSTSTQVFPLSESEKKQELHRMLGGSEVIQELTLPIS
jgi:DNA repair protein RecN (Recombination protein N)